MNSALASLFALVPTVFTDHKVTFNSEGEPVLVVRLTKAEGKLTAVAEPDIYIDEKLNKLLERQDWEFEDGTVVEIRFTSRDSTYQVNGKDVAPYSVESLLTFSDRFDHQLRELAGKLNEILNRFPPAEDLAKAVDHGVESSLKRFLIDGNVEAFMTGPTTFLTICKCEAAMAEQEKMPELPDELTKVTDAFIEVLGIDPEEAAKKRDAALKESRYEWTAARVKVLDWHNLVTVAPMSHEHPHFKMFVSIVTAAAQTFLTPDLVETKRRALLAKVRPVITAAKAD